MKSRVLSERISNAVVFLAICAVIVPGTAAAGGFIFAGESNGIDVVTHPLGYDGTGGELVVTVGINPAQGGGINTADMVTPVRNIVNTFNNLSPAFPNIFLGVSNDIPFGYIDFESVALHELGHAIGLAHTNLGSRTGVSGDDTDFTNSTDGADNTFALQAGGAEGADTVIGSADDERLDDVNLNWFKIEDNDPFTVAASVDSSTYSRDVAALPAGDFFSANSSRDVGTLLGYDDTEAVMQQGSYSDEDQRMLGAEDVAAFRYAMAGLDETEGTADDYTLTLSYAGITTAADIVLTFDSAKTGFAVTWSCGWYTPGAGDPSHWTILNYGVCNASYTYTPIFFNGLSYNWHFNSTLTVQNAGPVITGQDSLATFEETPLSISMNALVVSDPDNNYPADFALTVQDGVDYSVAGTTITPDPGFTGALTVPVWVHDGTNMSPVYDLEITVIPAPAYVYVSQGGLCNYKVPCETTIQEGIATAGIQTEDYVFVLIESDSYSENVDANVAKNIWLEGGWNAAFSAITGTSTVHGTGGTPSFSASAGSVVAANLEIE